MQQTLPGQTRIKPTNPEEDREATFQLHANSLAIRLENSAFNGCTIMTKEGQEITLVVGY